MGVWLFWPSIINTRNIIKIYDIDGKILETKEISLSQIQISALAAQFGYEFEDMCTPVQLNLGGSYEFGGKDFAIMNRWTLWGKASVSF